MKIKKKETIVFSEDSLMEKLHSFIDEPAYREIVIVAGHFMLFYDSINKRLVPGIFEDIENPALMALVRERVGIFPSYTWNLGVRLGEYYRLRPGCTAKLLILINDWQYVPDTGCASDHRRDFYNTYEEIPATFLTRLKMSKKMSRDDIFPSRRNPHAFPETWLKNRFKNEAARLVKLGKLKKQLLADNPTKSEILFTEASGTNFPLISCGMTGCAGEITEMISEVYRSGGRFIIIFAPSECHTPIRTGVEIALSIYELCHVKVIVVDLGGNGEMNTAEIYERGISVITYET